MAVQLKRFCCFFLLVFSSHFLSAQSARPIKIAVLAPLYLDSAFTDYTYNLGDKNIPQYILSGLDFYNGVMLAVDSLQKEKANIEVWVYDTKKINTDMNAVLKGMSFLNFSLIIASFTNTTEQKLVSDFSFSNNIPVISTTYPNDAGITGNPFFVMLNTTLKTHIDGIHKYVQQNYSTLKPIFISRSGALETKILDDFKANDTLRGNRLKYRTVMLNNDVNIDNLASYLDSTKQNVLICGSLNTDFAQSIADALCENPQYKTTFIGMPNWDGVHRLNNMDCNTVEIVYSTPYNYVRTDSVLNAINFEYRAKFFARPSDAVFKGYEAMYHFTHLLLAYKNEFINHLSDYNYTIAHNFYIKPVILPDSSFVPAYQENQSLYFIKKVSGRVVSSANITY